MLWHGLAQALLDLPVDIDNGQPPAWRLLSLLMSSWLRLFLFPAQEGDLLRWGSVLATCDACCLWLAGPKTIGHYALHAQATELSAGMSAIACTGEGSFVRRVETS